MKKEDLHEQHEKSALKTREKVLQKWAISNSSKILR